MLTYKVYDFKSFSQKYYNNCINNINFLSLSCSCGIKGSFIKHGYYTRSIKTPLGLVKLKILRVKCSSCGKTHAVLLSSIVPYSQISLLDQVNIIINPKDVMENNIFIDESNIAYTKSKYYKFFKEPLASFYIKLQPTIKFIDLCFKHLKRQFMQIRNTYKLQSGQIILVDNILFS